MKSLLENMSKKDTRCTDKNKAGKTVRLRVRYRDTGSGLLGGDVVITSKLAWKARPKLLAVFPEKSPGSPTIIHRSSLVEMEDI